MTETVVTVKCVLCGHEQDLHPGYPPKEELPACQKCMGPMYAKEAKRDG